MRSAAAALLLAAAGAAAAARAEDPPSDDAIVLALRDPEHRAKHDAAGLRTLATLAGERKLTLANSGLRALLRDDAQPADVRRAAADALGRTGSIADVAALGDGLRAVPEESARALAGIGGDAALSVLRRAAEGDLAGSPDVAAALAKLGDRTRLADVAALLDDAATRDRGHVLLRWATGRDLPPDRAAWDVALRRDELAARLADADNDVAQELAVELAGRARGGDAAVLDDLAALVADAQAPLFARCKAALAIGLSGARTKNDVLLAATANLQPGDLRWYAGDALGRVGDLSCAVTLVKMLVHDEDRDRIAARRSPRSEFSPVDPVFVRTLYRLGIRGATLPAIELLAGDYRTGLQRDAMRAFLEVSGGETFGYQPDAAKSERGEEVARIQAWWDERRETIPLAVRPDDPGLAAFRADVDALVTELGAFKFLHQLRAKKALAIVAEPATPQLVAALDAESVHVRWGAAEVMALSRLRAFAEPLAARLVREPNPAARVKIVGALEVCARRGAGWSAPAPVLGALRAALADRELDVRIAAARALGSVGDASDVARVDAARAEERNAGADRFRAASAAALLLLGERRGLADVVADLRSAEVAHREQARNVLRRAGVDLHGYDPDGAPEAREAAARAIEAGVPSEGRR